MSCFGEHGGEEVVEDFDIRVVVVVDLLLLQIVDEFCAVDEDGFILVIVVEVVVEVGKGKDLLWLESGESSTTEGSRIPSAGVSASMEDERKKTAQPSFG